MRRLPVLSVLSRMDAASQCLHCSIVALTCLDDAIHASAKSPPFLRPIPNMP